MRPLVYNKEELVEKIENLSIERNGNTVTTKYGNRIIQTASVSNRYEVFDIVKYLKDKIDEIESNFKINYYQLIIKRGVQILKLFSDTIELNGDLFYKSFYIINSTDKSKRLSFNVGLTSVSNDFYIVGYKNINFSKKHFKGITTQANQVSDYVGSESFDEQIENLKKLYSNEVKFSEVRKTILGEEEEVSNVNHKKFDSFKNNLLRTSFTRKISNESLNMLRRPSFKINDVKNSEDFYINAYLVLKIYMKIFNKSDSQIVRKETDRIMNITKWAERKNKLNMISELF